MVRSLVATAALAAGIAGSTGVALALHRQTPFLFALSKNPAGGSIKPHGQGEVASWVVFESSTDLLGTGSTGSQIFLMDADPAGAGGRILGQVTNVPPPAGGTGSHNPTYGGGFVVFDSDADILRNGSTGRQIYRWHRRSQTFTQITNATIGSSERPRIDADGNIMAFHSTADLRLNGSAGSNIYLWNGKEHRDLRDGRTSFFWQITYGPGDSLNPSWSLDSSKLVFQSQAPILGQSNGFFQIFMFEKTTRRYVQITAGNGDSINPTTDESGRLVAFQSNADLLGTGSSGWEVFIYDLQTNTLRQLTNSGGDSTKPSMGGGRRFVAFISTGDLLGTGPAGQHLYIYDLIEDQLYQVTRGTTGFSDNPVATADTIFFFDSSEDPMLTGITGQQAYILNIFQSLPGRSLGPQSMKLAPGSVQPGGGVVGSSVRLTTRGMSYVAPIGDGSIGFNITGRNYDGEAGLAIPANTVRLPPVVVPSFGAVCFQATANGQGVIDCDGDTPEKSVPDQIDVTNIQDHVLDPTQDPACAQGCREGDPSCSDPLNAPHLYLCPTCGTRACEPGDTACTCNGGSNPGSACVTDTGCPGGECVVRACQGEYTTTPGAACTTDAQCDTLGLCSNGLIPVCNGPVATHFDGSYGAGDMMAAVPLTAKLSTDPGIDSKFCTGDDHYTISDIGATLRLTTGVAVGGVLNPDASPGGAFLGAAEEGAPFSCEKLGEKNTSGARMVAAIPYLDVPTVPELHDVILTFRFVAERPPCGANCPAPCTVDAQCNDGNACNGLETCVDGSCESGTPILCSDGNACNGLETCDPATGDCSGGSPPICNDQNPCTDDRCDVAFGCINAFNVRPCDDNSICTLFDTCEQGRCIGRPVECADGNLCDGTELCDTAAGTCNQGPNVDLPCATDDDCPQGACIGNCIDGTPLTCVDNDACTTDGVCDNASGCRFELTPAAVTCNAGDGDLCNGIEACDPASGACVATPLDCDDLNVCTDDSCDPLVGCLHVPNTLTCDDLNACSTGDTCVAGACIGTPVLCGDGDACNGAEFCDPGSGTCSPGAPPDCDDVNACTIDTCAAAVGCVHTPDPSVVACDDGSLCTIGDACDPLGACIGTPVLCDNGQACDGVETCDPTTGACVGGTLLTCDDGVACTLDTCSDALGCVFSLPPDLAGVLCNIDVLRSMIRRAQFGQIKGAKLPRRLLRMLDRIGDKVSLAMQTSQPKAVKLLGASLRRVEKFERVVANGGAHDRIQPAFADSVVIITRSTRISLEGVLAAQAN